MGDSNDVIILSDDDIKVESVISPQKPKIVTNSRQVQATTSSKLPDKIRLPILILTEPKSISYGIERGYKLKHILGVKRLKNELMYLVEYDSCEDYEFVPSNILRQYCNEDILIEYLERLTQFID